MPTNVTAQEGQTLCEIGINNGFADGAKLRTAKDSQKDIVTLAAGQVVLVPDREKNNFDKALEIVHVFQRPHFPPPKIWFIRDDGNAAKRPPDPDSDPKLTVLAFTNYVEDRGSDGTVKGDFPGPAQQLYDAKGSADPDHFKVQVYDSDATLDTVTVDVVPMRPDYYALVQAGKTYVALHPTKRTPHTAHLMTVTLKRIPNTFYFRSPYMRLVPTKAGHAKRDKQGLLISGFWNDGGGQYLRRYGEQVHHTVRATYKLPNCPANKCAAVTTAAIEASGSIHCAFYILKTTSSTAAQVRETMYTWTRAVLAPTNIRPIIESINLVPAPANMLAIANDGATTPFGLHASGKRNPTTVSTMTFTIDGVNFTYSPTAGDTADKTADGIIRLVAAEPKLAGYTTKKFALAPRTPTAAGAANPLSASVDILFFKADGSMANVANANSTDFPDASGNFGQTLTSIVLTNNVPVGFPDATPEMRMVRYNFSTPGCINFYVVCTVLTLPSNGTQYDGWSPLGNFLGSYVDVGPCVFLTEAGVTRPFIMFHEVCHPLLHGYHAQSPFNDASIGMAGPNTVTSELMNPSLNDTDAHDATRHLADKPINAYYQLAEEGGASTLVNGSNVAPTSKVAWTPVMRLKTVGTTYGIVRWGDFPLLEKDITDLPHGP